MQKKEGKHDVPASQRRNQPNKPSPVRTSAAIALTLAWAPQRPTAPFGNRRFRLVGACTRCLWLPFESAMCGVLFSPFSLVSPSFCVGVHTIRALDWASLYVDGSTCYPQKLVKPNQPAALSWSASQSLKLNEEPKVEFISRQDNLAYVLVVSRRQPLPIKTTNAKCRRGVR